MFFFCNSVSFNLKGFKESRLFLLCHHTGHANVPYRNLIILIRVLILWSIRVAGTWESMPLSTRTKRVINIPTHKRFLQGLQSVVWSAPSTLLNMTWICCWSSPAISRFISVITVMVCRWDLSSSAATKLFHLLGDFITVCTLMVFSPIAKTPRCYL